MEQEEKMEDLEALTILTKEIQSIQTLPKPPPSHDGIEKFKETVAKVIHHAIETTEKVAGYGQVIKSKMEEMNSALKQSTNMIQEQIKKVLNSFSVGKNGEPQTETMDYMLALQKVRVNQARLEELIITTEQIMENIQQGKMATMNDIESIKGCLDSWMEEKEESYKDEQNRLENERIERENKKKLKEEEERKRKEDEESKRKKEEEQRRNEEEERRKNEAKEKQQREEGRKKKEEMEKKMKEEESKKREAKEKENIKRNDPAIWGPYIYRRSDGDVSTFHRGICCQVSAMTGPLQEDELECLASDEWRDEGPTLGMGEKLISSLIEVKVKENEKQLKIPLRVYVPHCSVSDSSDEVIVKTSIDDGEWSDQHPVALPAGLSSQSGLSYSGIAVTNFHTVKMLAVAKTRKQNFVVDKNGVNQASNVDKNIKLNAPRETFRKPTKITLEIRQNRENSLDFATQYYDHCHNVLSTSPVIAITCEAPTEKDIELDLKRNAQSRKRSSDKGKYCQMYKCRGDNWKIAESEIKGTNMGVSIKLPSRKEAFMVMEIEGRLGIPNEEFIKAADELYFHSNASIVRIIAKQRADNPYILMIQCVKREQVSSCVSELESKGYSVGPDTSKEFALIDGQAIILWCSGNIVITPESKVKLLFHVYMDTAKQEVNLQTLDEYKQKEFDSYIGQLQFQVVDDTREGNLFRKTSESLPINLPKRPRERTRTLKVPVKFPHYQANLARFLGKKLTHQAKDGSWLNVLLSLGPRKDMEKIRRRAVAQCVPPNNDSDICEKIVIDWMKSKPVQDDKIRPILQSLQIHEKKALYDECEKFVRIHKDYLSDDYLSEMAKKIENDWSLLARNLGLSDEDIASCKSDGSDTQREAFMMLSKWRVSQAVVNSGLDVFNNLPEVLETMQNSKGLNDFVRNVISLINTN